MIDWVEARLAMKEDGLVEKSRDVGFTWTMGGFALHRWRFAPGFRTTFGSRVVGLVDALGDPDTIFEKIRMLRDSLPEWLLPEGWDKRKHDHYLLMQNPENGNTIGGEGGDDMGRGGRSSLYVLDEFAFVPRADRVDAATSANTDVRIFGSSVNGMGNTFARKRFSMEPRQVFRLHYSDDPRITSEWVEKKRGSLEEWKWNSEYEIDYAASIEGVCIPAKWVEAAKKIGQHVKLEPTSGVAGLDVGGGGKGKSVFVPRFGPIVLAPTSWGDPDTIETAHRGLNLAAETKTRRSDGTEVSIHVLNFDKPGVGSGVNAALARSKRPGVNSYGINTGDPASDTWWPDGMGSGETAEERFANLKAEIWCIARERFHATYDTVRFFEGDKNVSPRPASELVSLPERGAEELIAQLSLPKLLRNEKGKMMLETKAQLALRGIPSPDVADAFVLTFVPSKTWNITADALARAAGGRR